MKALHVFDMDGTLIKEWDGWNRPVVMQAHRSIKTPGVYAVLLTGRPDALMRGHTIKQLRSQQLAFAEVRLATEPHVATADFKRRELQRILRSVQPDHVEFWDDLKENLSMFDSVMRPTGIPYKLHLVEM